jgi:membrane-associated protease RseP (regulator of RpoE activity)
VTKRDAAVHGGLFVACCITTTWFGGVAFGATLMSILLCHELGHFVVGRWRKVDVSLPYFIPLPPQLSLGTMGAVIQMRSPIHDRDSLFDVGASGPIAGLVVAIPLLVIGLSISHVGPINPGGQIEGNSLLYALLKLAVFGRWLPGDGVDVQLHPMGLAAWVGLLVTMINLLPIGQLDGGHVARAALGDRHEAWSARLHVALPLVGLMIGTAMFLVAREAGKDIKGALFYASNGMLPWGIWALMLGWMRRSAGEYHPAVSARPLGPTRKVFAVGMLLVFVLIATPAPFTPVL